MPDNLRGASAEETLQKTINAWKGYRDKEALREKLPADSGGYVYQPSDKVKPFVALDLADDPLFARVREAALAAELPPSKFNGFLDTVFGSMVDMGLVDAPVNATQVLGEMVPDTARQSSQDDQMKAAGQRVLAIDAAAKAWAKAQNLPEADARELDFLAGTASGLRLLEKLLPTLSGQQAQSVNPGGGSIAQGPLTRQDLEKRIADPRNMPGSALYEPAFEAETRRAFARLYPN